MSKAYSTATPQSEINKKSTIYRHGVSPSWKYIVFQGKSIVSGTFSFQMAPTKGKVMAAYLKDRLNH